MNIDDLSSRISKSFDRVDAPRPHDIAYVNDWDFESIYDDFRQSLNKPLNKSALDRHPKSLSALKPKAFVFFIKDYMRYALDNIDSELTEYLIYRLVSVDLENRYWQERIELFTSEQIKVISDFCTYLMEVMPEEEDYLIELLERAAVTWAKLGTLEHRAFRP